MDGNLKHLTKPLLPRRPDERIIYCYKDGPTIRRLQEYDEIVMALIDGDDMYSRDAGAIMMESTAEWMYFRQGYAYEEARRRLWTYDTIGTGPFWARRMNPRELQRFDRDKRHPTHKAVIYRFPAELPGGNFCVVLHDVNTSSTAHMRNVLEPGVDKQILKEFGYGL